MIYNETLNDSISDYKCGSCMLYIVLFAIFVVTSIVTSAAFICFYWYPKKIYIYIKIFYY